MKILGQVIRTIVNTALLPVAVAKDMVTLGGIITDEPSATKQAIERLKDEAGE